MIPETLLACLNAFEPCFRSPSYARFVTLMSGWVLCVGKHTVTGVMRGAGVTNEEHSGYHRFFNRGVWSAHEVGLVVLSMVLHLVGRGQRVRLTLDDSLARHTGKRISAAGMHLDPLLSTGAKKFFHFGHNWVVLAVAVTLPWGKTYSLPVLARLYRSVKTAAKEGAAHLKKTQIAAEMLISLANAEKKRKFLVFADNAYVNRSVVRALPENVDLIGRALMSAALFAPPPQNQLCGRGRGRPRIKGRPLPSPAQRAKRGRWTDLTVNIYGRATTVRVQVFDALWYKVGHGRVMRFVLIRNWPGHKRDDVLVSTDLELDAAQIIEGYCERWSIEETFGWVKSRLGFEHPQNRTPQAVERTAPMALWAYSIVVCWYVQWARARTKLPIRHAPWYRSKSAPSFADMLATMRRHCWTMWISDQADKGRLDQKSLAPLVEIAGYG